MNAPPVNTKGPSAPARTDGLTTANKSSAQDATDWRQRQIPPEIVERFLASGQSISGAAAMALFQPREEALVRLALDSGASVGEQQNAAIALIRSLRARGVDPELVITARELEQKAIEPSSDPGAVRMPWGKFRGLPLREIDPQYLRWVLWRCSKAAICADIRRYVRLP